ncbi:MAG: DUF4277 domain-containing protein [Crocosphaera sp.]|nr:DUF4277 domain-containing protein [Crocosphaera sp.]
MFSTDEISIQTINHLGLVAGIIDDIDLENIINEVVGSDPRELITSGQVVKGIILNGLGFTSQPLYLFPKFFEDKATEYLLGDGIKAEYLNDDKSGIPLFLRVADGNEQDKVVFGEIAVEYKSMIDFETMIVADSALSSISQASEVQ